MSNIFDEISRELPIGAKLPYGTVGDLVFCAYGCALMEDFTGDYYIYKAVNLETGKKVTLSRRKTQLDYREADRMAERIRCSEVAGAPRCEIDRNYTKSATFGKCRETLQAVFNEVMPKYGYSIRKEQIDLAEFVLQSIYDRKAVLAEAEVGTGKTHAYLIAAILAKRGRLNDFWNNGYFPGMAQKDVANMPIVIATSSIALQKAIINDYIPELSRMLIDSGIISAPLTAALRKGREHYICDRSLRSYYEDERNPKIKRKLKELMKPSSLIDLAESPGLTPYVKRRINVPRRCGGNCPFKDTCRYLCHMDAVKDPSIDIQVTNHNYLIADALCRADGRRQLLPNYQTIIIDEAHKFLQAARSMYGAELPADYAPNMVEYLKTVRFKSKDAVHDLSVLSKKLVGQNRRLFRELAAGISEDGEDDAERYCAQIDSGSLRHLRNIRAIAGEMYSCLDTAAVDARHQERKNQILWEIKQIGEKAGVFHAHKEHICWLEKRPEDTFALCSIPKELDKLLFSDFWSRRMPTILTSGTLSAGGDFSHTKKILGLDSSNIRTAEISKPSPFNHRDNTLLYISENMPFPNGKDSEYITAATDEIEKLVKAASGHSVVLFTSYDTMGRVYEELSERNIPFPLMRLERGDSNAIEQFKKTDGAVLFASGALWEGVDIPGDALSLLIIVKLPFQVPDPIGEYEQTLYKDFCEYKEKVVIPDMLIKLKQGFGRLIRTETDTGCVAILDSRANVRGAYRRRVLDSLPRCRVTCNIGDVGMFMRAKKPAGYFTVHRRAAKTPPPYAKCG